MKVTGQDLLYGVLAVLAGYVGYKTFKAVKAAGETGGKVADAVVGAVKQVVTEDLNPTSSKNLIYRAVSAAAPGDSSQPLGAKIYEWTHGDDVKTLADASRMQALKNTDSLTKRGDVVKAGAIYNEVQKMNKSPAEQIADNLELTGGALGN